MEKGLLGIGISVLSLAIIAGIAFMIIRVPALTIYFSQQSDLTGRAAGFLYGLAEEDIPTSEIAESVGINTLATKPAGGLQHPIGDVNQVAKTFITAGGEYLMIYTQDMYDTWYYQFDSLELYNEKVKTTVTEMENSEYKDKLVYCIYNEMDNEVIISFAVHIAGRHTRPKLSYFTLKQATMKSSFQTTAHTVLITELLMLPISALYG